MNFFNTHTHIFNVPCVPDAFITNYRFPQWLSKIIRAAVNKKWLRKIVLGIVKNVPSFLGGTHIRRYAALVEVAIHKYQDQVFETLISHYPAHARFVILTMNFDFMTGDAPEGNYNHYETQLHEVLEVKRKYGERILPFLFIDPRMGEEACMRQLHFYFDPAQNRGMAGIKLYPSLGYYPFHPALERVYAFAEEHAIPIITHSNKGGGAYFAGRFNQRIMSYNSFNPTKETSDFLNKVLNPFPDFKDPRDYANIMMHPMTYYDVLQKFPKLKICLAHYGGHEEILDQDNPKNTYNWTRTIKDLMRQFTNVYTDVSFMLVNDKASKRVLTDMSDNTLNKKILFGTDFFMTTPYDTDKRLTENFFRILAAHEQALTVQNPTAFLTSRIFKP
ncbi:MAG: amidohydrolase family protein [Bacteroidetes bacterium]|nr:amidohydrolase family protein [Bacteroidota bacterium]